MVLDFENCYSIDSIARESLFEQGIYVWLLKSTSLDKMPIEFPDQLRVYICELNYYILYVGTGPESGNVISNFSSRLKGCHINGNIYGSTFRYSVASVIGLPFYHRMVTDKKGKRKKRYYLQHDDEQRLNKFLSENCMISIFEIKEPWKFEQSIISYYTPPLNIEYNETGWFYKEIRQYRKMARRGSILTGNVVAD